MVHNDKARLHWCKVRDAVFGTTNRDSFNRLKLLVLQSGKEHVEKKGGNVSILSHGIKVCKDIAINYLLNQDKVAIKQVINCTPKAYLLLFTDGNLCHCTENGEQQLYCSKEVILSICFVDKFKSFVAVCADNNLRILDADLILVNAIPYSGYIHGIEYNTFTHEIITYGVGSVTVWVFRTSGTLLISRMMITDNILPDDSIEDICIERTSSENQRCFSVLKSGVLIHSLNGGCCLQTLQGIHDSPITNVLYFQPLKLLVTSGKDGCIKSWNEDGSLHCIFIGHTAEITSISPLPFEPKMMSTSKDGSLRTWNLETYTETDCHRFESCVHGANTQFQSERFSSFTKDILFLWGSNNIYSPFTVLKNKAKSIKTTTNPRVPPISYCICDDASVCIICPVSRKVITIFNSPDTVAIVDAVYFISENMLIVLLVDGRIIEASTNINPCIVKQIWGKESTKDCTSISLYEYMPESYDEDDQWKQINQNTFGRHQIDGCSDKIMLFGGCKDGSIVIYDWMEGKNNGSIVFSLQAHKVEVTAMSSNPKMDQLASTSKDKSLKVWRVFPFAEEALTPLLLFEDSLSINGIMFSNKTLCVIYQDMVRAYHTIGMYKTSHDAIERCVPPDVMKDHTDVILSLSTCPKLNLVASSSKDGNIHIRDTENNLLNVLKLNDIAHSISFCSQRGNLLIAIGTQIHIINYRKYMREHCLRDMVGIRFIENEISVGENDSSSPHPPLREFVDNIPNDELKRREEENQVKQHAFSILRARDEELRMIKEGCLKAKKYPQSSLDKDVAFQKYLDLFYKRPDVSYPEDDPEDEDTFIVKVDSSYRPDDNSIGFFSVNARREDVQRIKGRLKKCREEDQLRRKVASGGSDLEFPIKKIRSLSIETDQVDLSVKEKPRKQPLSASTTYIERLRALKTFTENNKQFAKAISNDRIGKVYVSSDEYPLNKVTKANVNKLSVKKFKEVTCEAEPQSEVLPVAPDGFIPNSVVVALYKELRRESDGDDLKNWKPIELTDDQLAQINDFNSKKLTKKIETPPQSITEDESVSWDLPDVEEKQSVILEHLTEIQDIPDIDTEDLTTPPDTPPISPPPPVVEKPVKRKPIMKLVSTAVAMKAAVPKPPSPPPPLPLPQFVLQFKECDWYKQCFAHLTGDTFEQPHTVGNFIKLLLKALTTTKEYNMKTGIVKAILLLLNQEQFDYEIGELVQNEILAGLNMPGGEPSCEKFPDHDGFIKICLQLLLALKGAVPLIVAELMTQYILAPPLFRKEIMKTFEELGLQDSKEFFPAELHSFDVSLVVQSQIKNKLNELSLDWLTMWMKNLRQHISSLTGKIKRASKGNNTRKLSQAEWKQPKGILKKKNDAAGVSKSISFVSDNFVGEAAKNISTIDAINYFCEMKFEEELERLKRDALKKRLNSANKDRNTIIYLPKIDGIRSLVRLGETHKSVCHPERETSLARILPPIRSKSGVRSLLLRMNTLRLVPFPDELDELIYAPAGYSDLITLQYSQKYFVHSSSFI